MLNDLVASGERFELVDIMANVLIAFAIGTAIALIYRRTHRGFNYSCSFVNTLVLLPMITTVVMMVIGNSLARAFGLVGAMSIVRFRHAVKNTQDIVYVFFALAVGMAAGVGFYTIAITGTLFIGLIVWLLSRSRAATPGRDDHLLQFNYRPGQDKTPPYQVILDGHCRKATVINVRSLGDQDLMELSYYVRLKHRDRGDELIRDLNRVPGVQFVNLFFDEEQI